ncbi:MarR family winged helix-turn-helix transcriptional regulator [Streptomyces sp. NPDC021093]|uniref:MarR family winged helix-turn-helix transcriptional regulator n=1 Tax=Streptomyces sp. NPDC021093 TaxID=3365112 RepID=UPI0037B9BEB2
MPAPDVFDDPRLTTMGLLLEAHDGLLAKLAPTLKKGGLSALDFNVLMRLSRSPGQRQRMSDLAAQTMLSTSGITRVVDRLERAELVSREPCPDDRRSTLALLSPEGADRLRQVLPDHLEAIEHWFTGRLAAEQLDALIAGLRTLRDAVHPDAAGSPAL